ncbi:AzlD domain-containing protein [Thermodesulfatator atlanticus]
MNGSMEKYFVLVFVAIGTYLIRLVPIVFRKNIVKNTKFDLFLSRSSVALLSGLFVTSFVSFPLDCFLLFISLCSLIVVYISFKFFKNLGFSVLVGVLVHFALFQLFSLFSFRLFGH